MSFYTRVVRPILFLTDPERVHYRVFNWLKLLYSIPGSKAITRPVFSNGEIGLRTKVFGIDFPNRVGLAAGLDKDAKLFVELSALGFGFIEVGTVTPLAQPGNEKPRLFRLPADMALINRMGFNNEGVEAMVSRLKKRDQKIIIGGNIGKNKNTPNENAVDDYEICFRRLYKHVNYFAVNVSSPNTPGLRALQDKGPLLGILNRLQEVNRELAEGGNTKPILLKIAPDLTIEQLDEMVEVVTESSLNGIIATNTTISREGLNTGEEEISRIGRGRTEWKATHTSIHRSDQVSCR